MYLFIFHLTSYCHSKCLTTLGKNPVEIPVVKESNLGIHTMDFFPSLIDNYRTLNADTDKIPDNRNRHLHAHLSGRKSSMQWTKVLYLIFHSWNKSVHTSDEQHSASLFIQKQPLNCSSQTQFAETVILSSSSFKLNRTEITNSLKPSNKVEKKLFQHRKPKQAARGRQRDGYTTTQHNDHTAAHSSTLPVFWTENWDVLV